MAEDVKQEMNTTPGCIPSKWTRNTVADGDWLQKYTIAPLSSRDDFLADKISGAEFNIDEEIKARKAGDDYLSANLIGFSAEYFEFKDNVETSAENLSAALKAEIDRATFAERQEENNRAAADIAINKRIDNLEAATDVVMVFSTYDEFSSTSGDVLSGLTDRDVVKVLRDEHYVPEGDPDESSEDDDGFQVYYQWHDYTHSATLPDWKGWSAIGSLDPYYSISEIDNITAGIYQTIEDVSATVSSNYLSANGTAIQSGHNIQISAHPTNPYILIETKDNVDFTNVSSTTFSGINIYGSTKNTTIDGLIGSAESGQDAWNKVNSAYWSASNFEGTNTASGRLSGSFELSAGENIDLSIVGNRINIDVLPGTHYYEARCDLFNPADIDNNTTFWKANGENILNDVNDNIPVIIKNLDTHELWSFKKFHNTESTDYDVYFSTVTELTEGHNIVIGSAHITKDTDLKYKVASCNKYLTNSYSATIAYQAQNLGNVGSADVIGSAESGKFAWNVINSAKFSAIDTTTSTDYISGGFAIKAGDNLTLTYANKTITLNASDTGITAISVGNTTYTGPVFSASAGTGINFVNGNNNVLGIKASDTLINSATGGSAAYNWITAQSATLYPGSGINFYNAGSNRLGIAVDYSTATEDSVTYVTALDGIPLSAGANYTEGRCITFDEQNNINLSSDINLNSKLVIDHYDESDSETYATANLESFKLDFSGSRDSVGSFRGQSATYRIDNLKIDNYSDEDNLYFAELDKSKLQISAYNKIGVYSVSSYTNIAKDYFETQKAGSNYPYYLKFDGEYISAGTNTSNVTAVQWHDIIHNATGTWVSGTSEQITIDAPYQTKIVVTASVPVSFNANTYYII